MVRQDSPRRRLRILRRRRDFLKLRMLSRDRQLSNVSFEVDEYYALAWAIDQLTPIHETIFGDRKPKLVRDK